MSIQEIASRATPPLDPSGASHINDPPRKHGALPTFPEMAPLCLAHRSAIADLTAILPPYSDFGCMSLLSWDSEGTTRIAQLNGNLVVQLRGYLDNSSFYSFLGINQCDATAQTLLNASESEGLPATLRLVPEETAAQLSTVGFFVKEDRDNFDYLLDLSDLSTYHGRRYSRQRTNARKVLRAYPVLFRRLNFVDSVTRCAVLALCETWALNKAREGKDIAGQADNNAIATFVRMAPDIDSISLGMWVDEHLIGFAIADITHARFATVHFLKTDASNYPGSTEALMQGMAVLLNHGCTIANIEQDLGIPSLRVSKMRYKPIGFLKKFSVTYLDHGVRASV